MIEISILPSKALKISITADGKQWLTERLADGQAEARILKDLLEPYWTNGQFHPFEGDDYPWVGLTNAPCIAEALDFAEHGEAALVGKLWWFPQYERVGPLETLRDEGSVIYSFAPDDVQRMVPGEGRARDMSGATAAAPVGVVSSKRGEAFEFDATSDVASDFAARTGDRFFLITDFEKVELLKAQSYEEAFVEIEGRDGVTWVAAEDALRRMHTELSEALGADAHLATPERAGPDPVTSGWLAALSDAYHTAGLPDHTKSKLLEILTHMAQAHPESLPEAQPALASPADNSPKTKVCLSTVTMRVLHEVDADIRGVSLGDIARECDVGDWVGGGLTVTTSAPLTREHLSAVASSMGSEASFFGEDGDSGDGVLDDANSFLAAQHELLVDLASKLTLDDALDEILDGRADDMKGELGALMANDEPDEAEQAQALNRADEWVAAHVSNGTLADRLAAVLWLDGEEKTRAFVAEVQQRQTSGAERPRG